MTVILDLENPITSYKQETKERDFLSNQTEIKELKAEIEKIEQDKLNKNTDELQVKDDEKRFSEDLLAELDLLVKETTSTPTTKKVNKRPQNMVIQVDGGLAKITVHKPVRNDVYSVNIGCLGVEALIYDACVKYHPKTIAIWGCDYDKNIVRMMLLEFNIMLL